jgi:4-aminobutyrate aminotransferase-like enzyme
MAMASRPTTQRSARRLLSTARATVAQATVAAANTGATMKLPPHQRPALSQEENMWLRRRHLAPALKAHYADSPAGPLHLVHGSGQYLYTQDGKEHLDLVNNVCHVGHCHPRIATAASVQLGRLNTNSRYLHDNIVRLGYELSQTMPAQLTTCFFVNSGSEANDLALRLARNHCGRQDVYTVDGAYHGNSTATLAISPYSRYAPIEKPDGVQVLMQPDPYRLGLTEREVRSLPSNATGLATSL